jgi:hypothetical protein
LAILACGSAGIKLIGTGDVTTDEELQNMGDPAIGTMTMHHYSAAGDRPANKAFVAAYKAEFGPNEEPGFEVPDAYDGMAAIFHVIIAQKGNIDPDKTMELLKGWKYDSPRTHHDRPGNARHRAERISPPGRQGRMASSRTPSWKRSRWSRTRGRNSTRRSDIASAGIASRRSLTVMCPARQARGMARPKWTIKESCPSCARFFSSPP